MYGAAGDKAAKITANPGNDKGAVQIDLKGNDKVWMKTLPNDDTEITFNSGKRGKLLTIIKKDGSLQLDYTNKNN